ncbi:hypothetical protein Nepgr_007039 [Nepenthes gracilis]|uniref:RNase H type-1 domain-containing protein n=1 Tax=Nepenthes gracilis TaxID=150966 RepID=A0AAD3S6G1_NEPGR|nr:hypothetical protein Nepgr_007039 [Nepenthes gracilis]
MCLDAPDVSSWILNVDGSSTQIGSRARVVPRTLDGKEIKYSVTLTFLATNNVAGYETLLVGLHLKKECSVKSLVVRNDSELVVNQIQGAFEVSNPQLVKYLVKAKAQIQAFECFKIEHILRAENWKANQLVRDATVGSPEQYARSLWEILAAPSIDGLDQEVLQVNKGDN